MLHFKPGISLQATQLESGDKYDQSVVHLLSTIEGNSFLVEKKSGLWIVTAVVVNPVVTPEVKTKAKVELKPEKPVVMAVKKKGKKK